MAIDALFSIHVGGPGRRFAKRRRGRQLPQDLGHSTEVAFLACAETRRGGRLPIKQLPNAAAGKPIAMRVR
jgi:hypothetical protein